MDWRFIVLGLFTGIASGLLGLGGGIIMVPFMIYVMKLPYPAATGTSLMAMVLPVGALGVYHYYKSGHINETNFKWGLMLAIGLFIGTFIGARLLPYIPLAILSKVFAVFMVYGAVRMWLSH